MSPLPSLQPIHHYGYFLDFPTRKRAIALTLILRVLEYPFKLSNNQVEVSKYSITADTAIRIVHYPAGVYIFTRVSSLIASFLSPFKRVSDVNETKALPSYHLL